MIAAALPLGTLLVLGVVLLIAHAEDVRAKRRRFREMRRDDQSIESWNERRRALP